MAPIPNGIHTMLYTNELGQKAAERQALAWMMADFIGAGRQIQQIATPAPEPLPMRRDWIDPETKLKRQAKPAPKPEKAANGIKKAMPGDADTAALLQRCADDGMSLAEAGRLLGVGESTARRKAVRLGIVFSKYNEPKQTDAEVAELARSLFAEGHKLSTVASRIGCGKNRLLRICYEHGIIQEGNQQ